MRASALSLLDLFNELLVCISANNLFLKGCLVSQSRFTKSQLQCERPFHKTYKFWVVIGVAALLVTALVASAIIWKWKANRGSFSVQGNPAADSADSCEDLQTCTKPLESNILQKSKRQSQESSHSKISRHLSSEIVNSVTELEDIAPDKTPKFSPKVDGKSPPVSLAWVVGKNATAIEIHELTLNFPAECLKQERRINISVRRYVYEEDPVYVYTITPHKLVFDKPVTVQLNRRRKDPTSAFLRKRKSQNDDWITVGTFANDKGVSMDEFCDLCPTYKERTAELGKGFSFNNVSVAAQRDSQFVTLEVNLLADACNDTLQSQVSSLVVVGNEKKECLISERFGKKKPEVGSADCVLAKYNFTKKERSQVLFQLTTRLGRQ